MPFGWVLAGGFVAGLAAFALGYAAADEGLWVDELHTSWVVSASLDELAVRAAAGNQTAWYFYLIFGFRQFLWTVGEQFSVGWLTEELMLRLPSISAWSLTAGLVAVILLRRSARNPFSLSTHKSPAWPYYLWLSLPIAGWCLCMVLDRIQWFYGVEARVYSMVQLLNVLGWLIVLSVYSGYTGKGKRSERPCKGKKAPHWNGLNCCSCLGSWSCLGWSVIAIALINLHITSLPSVLTQLVTLCVLAVMQPKIRVSLLLSILLFTLVGWFTVSELQPIWDRRTQWQSVGGNANLTSLLNLLPILPTLVPVTVAWIIVYLAVRLGFRRENSSRFFALATNQVGLWALAFWVPYLSAWMMAWLEIAPLFHYRFVITASVPLYLFTGSWLLQLPWLWLRWMAVLVSIVWVAHSQGSLSNWQRGKLLSEFRGEGWREAARYVSGLWDAGQDALWCSSGLIEGQFVIPPLNEADNIYLSYPLRGCYRVIDDGKFVVPQALAGRSHFWTEQLNVGRENKSSDLTAQARRVWIVCRGNGSALERRLQRAGLTHFPRRFPIVEFGRVSVVCLEVL